MSSDTIVDPNVVGGLDSAVAVSNYINTRIEAVISEMRHEPPPPTNQLDSAEYLRWRAKLNITYGRAIEAIMFAQAFSYISVEQFYAFKKRLLGVFLVKHTDVVCGTDPAQLRR